MDKLNEIADLLGSNVYAHKAVALCGRMNSWNVQPEDKARLLELANFQLEQIQMAVEKIKALGE